MQCIQCVYVFYFLLSLQKHGVCEGALNNTILLRPFRNSWIRHFLSLRRLLVIPPRLKFISLLRKKSPKTEVTCFILIDIYWVIDYILFLRPARKYRNYSLKTDTSKMPVNGCRFLVFNRCLQLFSREGSISCHTCFWHGTSVSGSQPISSKFTAYHCCGISNSKM